MNDDHSGAEQPLISHLLELRNRLLYILYGMGVFLAPLAYYAREIYSIAAAPLLKMMPAGTSMIATQVASPFFTPLKLAMVLAFAASMPWTLWQIWSFVAPGLYKKEKRLAAPLMISSTLLFYGGVAFAYFGALPKLFELMIKMAPMGVAFTPDINEYLNTVLGLSLAFGIAFEVPVAVVLLVAVGFVTPRQLKEQRGYVLVGVFIAAAVLTPPDPMSQFALAIPMYILYELGIIAAGLLTAPTKADGAADKPQIGS